MRRTVFLYGLLGGVWIATVARVPVQHVGL